MMWGEVLIILFTNIDHLQLHKFIALFHILKGNVLIVEI